MLLGRFDFDLDLRLCFELLSPPNPFASHKVTSKFVARYKVANKFICVT